MNQKGFTLIELLFVLSILTILISLIVPHHLTSLQKQSERLFIEQLHSDVLLIQNQSHIVLRDQLVIRLYNDHYLIQQRLSQPYAVRNYPDGWSYNMPFAEISFRSFGTFVNPRKINMYTKEGIISFVFPLGKGRFYVDESKRIHTN